MKDKSQAIGEFWNVFLEKLVELEEISSAYDTILEHLQQIHPGIYFDFFLEPEISKLIITAEGTRSLFSLVDSIVARAPNIPGWSIFSLRPKFGFSATAMWEDISVAIAEVFFIPLERDGSDDFGLCLFVPGLIPEEAEVAHNALLRVLSHAIGEREFAESVQYTEVLPLPDNFSEDEYIPIIELEDYIRWREKE